MNPGRLRNLETGWDDTSIQEWIPPRNGVFAIQWGMAENPFVYSRVLAPGDVVNREAEVDTLLEDALGGHYVRLVAPRRYGKTSLMGKVLAQAKRRHGLTGVLVDFFGVVSLADVAIRVERAYAHHLDGGLRTKVESHLKTLGLGLSLGVQGISVRLHRRSDDVDPLPALHALLDLPREANRHTGRRVLVVFDEFQDVLALDGVDGIIRSHIQHQGEVASYVFCGSQPGMMARLFGQRDRPLFGQAKAMELGPLPDADLGAYIERRFAKNNRSAGEVLQALLTTSRGHPQRAMFLAHHLFAQVRSGKSADAVHWQLALDAALAGVDEEFEAHWRALKVVDQRVLRAIATYGSPYREDAIDALALTSGAIAAGLMRLRDNGEVTRDGFRIVDPLLELWIRRRF